MNTGLVVVASAVSLLAVSVPICLEWRAGACSSSAEFRKWDAWARMSWWWVAGVVTGQALVTGLIWVAT